MDSRPPPGTVTLVEFENATDATHLVLVPQPSDDPNDPLNWSMLRKSWNYLLVSAMSVAAFTFLTVQTIFWQQMSPEMELSLQQLSNSVSAQLAGAAVGCIFFVPFAVKYGRRSAYLLSVGLMAAVSWWTSRMSSYAELIVTNLLTGIFCSINETTAQMTISDLFFVHQRGTANGIYFVMVNIGSFLTPMIAGSQAAAQGWRWSYYALSISLTILFVIFVISFEETKYVPIHQGQVMTPPTDEGASHQKATDSIVNGGDIETAKDPGCNITKTTTSCSPQGTSATNSYWQRMRLVTPTSDPLLRVLVAPFKVIFFPHLLFTALQFASGVCWLVLLLNGTSIIFSAPPYNFSTAGIGYMATGPFIGNIFGTLYGGPLSDWSITYFARRRNGGVFEPEMRLYILLPPCLFMAGGLAMFGATAGRGMHWIYPSIGGAFFAFGLGATGDIAFTFVIDTYRDLVAEAFVGIAFLRNAISICIPLTLVQWMGQVGVVYMFVTAAMICLFIGLLFIPMIIWGKRIRIALAKQSYTAAAKSHLQGRHGP